MTGLVVNAVAQGLMVDRYKNVNISSVQPLQPFSLRCFPKVQPPRQAGEETEHVCELLKSRAYAILLFL